MWSVADDNKLHAFAIDLAYIGEHICSSILSALITAPGNMLNFGTVSTGPADFDFL